MEAVEAHDVQGGSSSSVSSSIWPRVSLACLQCRNRHVRCDAATPRCTRCLTQDKPCSYLKSRRGGRPRKSLPQICDVVEKENLVQSSREQFVDFDFDMSQGEHLWNLYDDTWSDSVLPDHALCHAQSGASNDELIKLYYDFFHSAHPCALPQDHLKLRRVRQPGSVRLLEHVMCWIGSLYTLVLPSEPYEIKVRNELSHSIVQASTGFNVQALLLYSIAVYWNDDIERASAVLDSAICMALDIGMHRLEFAKNYGESDLILEESWRRTWWQLYITDLHVAASSHVMTWPTSGIDTTVELPCEEHEYESGKIPKPQTLLDYENREFADAESMPFSSFAHVVGLTRCFDLSLAGASRTDEDSVVRISQETGAAVAAWSLLLPKCKKELLRSDGSVDEMLFKANMLMHTYVVDTQRPLSSLAYSAIENRSRCAPPAPPESVSTARAQQSHVHNMKILRAIESLTGLLTLPTQLAKHTPFVICMIATTTIAHLSACRYVLQGRNLKIARERIRTAMGALKAYEDIWALGKRTHGEVSIVAREILSLTSEKQQTAERRAINVAATDKPNPNVSENMIDDFCLFTGVSNPNLELDR